MLSAIWKLIFYSFEFSMSIDLQIKIWKIQTPMLLKQTIKRINPQMW
jgi:hypothetical protein